MINYGAAAAYQDCLLITQLHGGWWGKPIRQQIFTMFSFAILRSTPRIEVHMVQKQMSECRSVFKKTPTCGLVSLQYEIMCRSVKKLSVFEP